MYKPTLWKDEVVEHPYRYKEVQNEDGSVEHNPDPGTILQEGTPQSAANFNNAEYGITDSHLAESIWLQYWRLKDTQVAAHLTQHDEEFSSETGTVTLNNTNSVSFLFNNSGSTVALKKVRNTMNYDLDIEVVEVIGGRLGEVEVYDKQLNGFKLRFTGSASQVKIKYKVRGGMYA